WTVANVSTTVNTPGVLQIDGDIDFAGEDDTIRLVRDAGNTNLLDVFVNGTRFGPYEFSALTQINVNGLGGNDRLIVDSSNGLIDGLHGIRYDGGAGSDRLDLTQTGGPTQLGDTLGVGATPGNGRSTIVGAADSQVVSFENLEPVTDTVPAASFSITSIP